ncbi:hypothetical protein F4677DRAFT_172750 [Hypoxylon crocopeplum]|nr:hypothetical protein F4677DRAFT_172750 [Hypoxylon crocopeplum]
MKFVAIILASCLWLTANATPIRSLNRMRSLTRQHGYLNHRVEECTHHYKNATIPISTKSSSTALPQASSVSANLTSNYTTIVSPSSFGSYKSNLTTYCNANNSTYVHKTAKKSPPASDCAAIAHTVIPKLEAGYWHYNSSDVAHRHSKGFNLLLKHGACAFGVKIGKMHSGGVRIGTLDVAKVIEESVRLFAHKGAKSTSKGGASKKDAKKKLDVSGAFKCDGSGTHVDWALYHV